VWTGTRPMAFAYQWQRCRPDGAACKTILRATAQNYVATAEDVGQRLVVLVAAKSSAGRTDAESPKTDEVAAIAPAPAGRPLVQRPPGALQVGSILTSVLGAWTGSKPVALAYQWLRCDRRGKHCRVIEKATRPTYPMQPADFDETGKLIGLIRVTVAGSNPAGSRTSWSLPFGRGLAGGATGTTRASGGGASSGTGGARAAFDSRGRVVVRYACPKGPAACAGRLALAAPGLRQEPEVDPAPRAGRAAGGGPGEDAAGDARADPGRRRGRAHQRSHLALAAQAAPLSATAAHGWAGPRAGRPEG